MNSQIREGPEYKDPNKMKRADYMKNLDERRKERLEYYKRLMDSKEALEGVPEEESPDVIRNRVLVSQLKRLTDMNKVSIIKKT